MTIASGSTHQKELKLRVNVLVVLNSKKKNYHFIIKKFMINIIKYVAAITILVAIGLHAFDMYPYNVFVHIAGAILWTYVGIKWKEGSILLNFVPQIFILGAGLIYFILGL